MPKLRVAPSLGALEGDPHEVWGLEPYWAKLHREEPTVFMGLYGFNDFYELWKHRGKKWVFWCGSDIRHFIAGYWLDDEGETHVNAESLAEWINKYCESWCENEVEQQALANVGIYSQVCPSFMGNIKDYEVSFEPNGHYYASVSGNDFKLYKWDALEELAKGYPELTFHLYGNTVPWVTKNKNVVVHGRIDKEDMNEEIKQMEGGIRLLEFDGFSEVIAKSILWGQWPVSAIPYKHVGSVYDLMFRKNAPNFEGRNYYLRKLNDFPWVNKEAQPVLA